jgi:hypothetical protein
MRRRMLYFPHNFLLFLVLAIILVLAVIWIFLRVLGLVFSEIGLSPGIIALILVSTFVGSYVKDRKSVV